MSRSAGSAGISSNQYPHQHPQVRESVRVLVFEAFSNTRKDQDTFSLVKAIDPLMMRVVRVLEPCFEPYVREDEKKSTPSAKRSAPCVRVYTGDFFCARTYGGSNNTRNTRNTRTGIIGSALTCVDTTAGPPIAHHRNTRTHRGHYPQGGAR